LNYLIGPQQERQRDRQAEPVQLRHAKKNNVIVPSSFSMTR